MALPEAGTIGLVVRTGPYGQRSARAQLDVALAVAALEQPLRLYFLGDSVLQLLLSRDPAEAHLPPGYRAWAGLPELTRVSAFAEPVWVGWLQEGPFQAALPVAAASRSHMQRDWRACSRVMVL